MNSILGEWRGGGHFLFVRIFRFMIQYSELQYNLIDEEENSTEISNPTLLVLVKIHINGL